MSFRVRVDLRQVFSDERSRVWMLVPASSSAGPVSTVGALARRLALRLGAPRDVELAFLLEGHMLPAEEALQLLQPGDALTAIPYKRISEKNDTDPAKNMNGFVTDHNERDHQANSIRETECGITKVNNITCNDNGKCTPQMMFENFLNEIEDDHNTSENQDNNNTSTTTHDDCSSMAESENITDKNNIHSDNDQNVLPNGLSIFGNEYNTCDNQDNITEVNNGDLLDNCNLNKIEHTIARNQKSYEQPRHYQNEKKSNNSKDMCSLQESNNFKISSGTRDKFNQNYYENNQNASNLSIDEPDGNITTNKHCIDEKICSEHEELRYNEHIGHTNISSDQESETKRRRVGVDDAARDLLQDVKHQALLLLEQLTPGVTAPSPSLVSLSSRASPRARPAPPPSAAAAAAAAPRRRRRVRRRRPAPPPLQSPTRPTDADDNQTRCGVSPWPRFGRLVSASPPATGPPLVENRKTYIST